MTIFKIMIKLLFLLLITNLSHASIPLAARMGAGGKMDMFGCMLSNDFYIANFAAYQADPQQPKNAKVMPQPLCQEIPKTGETQITVDMLDRDVRQKAVTLKVFNSDKHLLSETPTKVLKQGYISTSVNFPKAGHYDLAVYVDDQDLKIAPEVGALHIPLTVAVFVPAPSASITDFLMIIGGIGVLALGLGVVVPKFLKSPTAV